MSKKRVLVVDGYNVIKLLRKLGCHLRKSPPSAITSRASLA